MRTIIRLLFIIAFVFVFKSVSAQDNDFEQIMQNVRQWSVYSPQDSIIQSYLASMGVDGSFSDINYSDQTSTWQPQIHYYRLLPMAYAYISPQNTFYNDSSLYNKIVLGINYWLSINPHSTNWYHNRINEPLLYGLILIAMRDGEQTLPSSLESQIIERWRNNGSNPANYAGSNKSEMALHWMYFACLTTSQDTLNLALNYIFEPVVYTNGEGLQVDNCFLQHGPQLYIGGYGEVMLETVLQTAVCVAGTDYSLPNEKLTILREYVLNSYANVIRGDVIHWNSIGRQLTRPDFLRYPERRIPIIEQMRAVDGEYYSKYTQILNRLTGQASPGDSIQPYHAHFFRGDYSIHVRPEFSFSTRMVSSRTCRQEILNGENLLGYWLSDGSTVITSSGREYLDLMPLWNWNKIPGVTAPLYDTIPVAPLMTAYGTSVFAGGVSDSIYGCTAYKYYDEYSNVNTGASKGYFFFDDEVVCLGAGISSSHDSVQTTINQCWGKKDVVVGLESNYNVLTGNINQTVGNNLSWVLHDGMGYFFPDTQQIVFENKEKTGNWRWISTMWADEEIIGKIFTLGINHSSPVQNEKYSYIVIPNSTTASMNAYASNNNIEILANTDSVQVVYHNQKELYECIFYRACVFNVNEEEIRSFQPCVMMAQKQDDGYVVHIADPTQSKTRMIVGIKWHDMDTMAYYASDYTEIDDQYAGMTTRMNNLDSLFTISIDTQEVCESFTWIDGITYTESTSDPLYILKDSVGLDSIVRLHLTINHGTHNVETEVACDSYEWHGTTYETSGVYTYEYSNESGCASADTLYLTVNTSSTGIDTQTACESFMWIDGNTYTESTQIPTYTLTNAMGCDSIVTLHLTVNHGSHNVETEIACDSYEWHGTTYETSGVYTYEYSNESGCASADTLYLTVNTSSTGIDTQTACESFTWIDGNTYTESTQIPTYTLTNAMGCDSIVTLHLTVNHGTHNVETEVACDSYEWHGTTYETSGVYTYEYSNESGCASADTLYLTVNTSSTGIDTQTACESFTWIDGNTYTESTQIPTYTLTNAMGCDSIVTLHLTVNHGTHNVETEVACDSYEWHGTTYETSGVYTYEYSNESGCASADTLYLTINYTVFEEITIETVDSCYNWNGQIYCASGDYIQTFNASNGCDSIVTLHLTTDILSIENHEWNRHVYLAPNPAKHIVRIIGLEDQPKSVDVIDMHGCLVLRDRRKEFDVSSLTPGVYLVRIQTVNGTIVRRIIKQ